MAIPTLVDRSGIAAYTSRSRPASGSRTSSGPFPDLRVAATIRTHRSRLASAPTLALLLLAAGCHGSGEAVGPAEGYHHPMVGQAAPDFAGEGPFGGWLPLSSFRDKPVAIVFYRPGMPFTREMATAIGAFRNDPSMAPTVFLGVAPDTMESIRRFSDLTHNALPTIRDPGSIATSYQAATATTVVLVDSHHLVRYRLDGFGGAQFRARVADLAQALKKLPSLGTSETPELAIDYTRRPKAPVFAQRDLDGRTFDLAAQRGHVVVVIFFDQECPHCQRDLPRLAPVLKEYRERGVRAVGISSRDLHGQMRGFLRQMGTDFPVIIDPDRAIFARFASTRTPDTFIIDGDGLVRFREHGDRPDRAELTRLQLAITLGRDKPEALAAALPKGRYVGDAFCAACHEREHDDWLLTPHSIAWDSLAKGDKWKDPECVRCHVTGYKQPGGFDDPATSLHMSNVQCEICHGMGGGHPDGKPLDPDAMASGCTRCHTGKFVLNFKIEEAIPLVAHQDHPDMDRLFRYSGEQRQRIDEINKRRLEKFRSGVAYVGVEACRDCHRKEYDQWAMSPHAAAFTPLLKQSRGGDSTCTPCHTTGAGQKHGFGDLQAQVDMANVQCEVCHGPGEDHVKAPPALKKDTIYGITDQCSFCIIQGVCATCHDAKNDPQFDIEKALVKVKH
jgi:peroxiredoxin